MAKRWRVLAIDDSLTIRKLLELSLGKLGYDLDLATTGAEGISCAQRHAPDVILLDYVLPDMKGVDVCQTLSEDAKTRAIPVIVMSAKGEAVRERFKPFSSVVEVIGKPFTPPEIKFQIGRVIGQLSGSAESGADHGGVQFDFTQKETAAKALFGTLRGQFARIPEWHASLGSEPPALYFAKKILTPELMDVMLTQLAPLFSDTSSKRPAAKDDDPPSVLLKGQTSLTGLVGLLRLFRSLSAFGLLTLDHDKHRSYLWFRRGEIVLASSNQPDEYSRMASADLSAVGTLEMAAAEAAQRDTGKPVFVSYAESSHLPAAQLPELLHTHGKRVLLNAMDAGPGRFTWHDHIDQPSYVEANARPMLIEQLELERLRRVDDSAQMELHVSSVDAVFERCAGFAAAVRNYELLDKERAVLRLVNRRNSVKQIIEKTALPTFEVFHTLFCMSHVGIIRVAQAAAPQEAPRGRPILMGCKAADEVQKTLAELLQRRRNNAVPLIAVAEPSDLIQRCVQEPPALVLLRDMPGTDATQIARELRARMESADVKLAAIIDGEQPERCESLISAGFDSVLQTPFLLQDVLDLMVA